MENEQSTGIHRRAVIGAAAADTGALDVGAASSPAAATRAQGLSHGEAPREYVLTGGYVLSMDPAVGDLDGGDVHVSDGRIVAVGRGISSRGSPATAYFALNVANGVRALPSARGAGAVDRHPPGRVLQMATLTGLAAWGSGTSPGR